MPIIGKPVEILKNQDNIFTLDKVALGNESKVSSDPYFSDQANWKKVFVAYLTDVGNQVEFVDFDATLGSPTGNFRVSDKARDLWQVDALIIQDFDGGYLRFERSELTTAEFDVDFGAVAPPPAAGYFSNDFDTGLAAYEGYSSNGATQSGPESLLGTLILNDDVSGNMSYIFRVHDDVASTLGYVEGNTNEPFIVVDDLSTGIDINFDVTSLQNGPLDAKVRVQDDLFSTGAPSGATIPITGTGNYTVSITKNLMEINSATVIQEIKLEFTGGTGFSQITIDNVTITADQTSGNILEQNVVAPAVRDAGADLGLDNQNYTQTFSHNTNFSIEQVQLHMDIFANTGATPRTATIEARILDTDQITILGSKQKVVDVVPGNTQASWQAFKFDTPITGLLSGATYTIELVAISGFSGSASITSRLEVTYNNPGTYANGDLRVSGPIIGDCAFRVIGTEV